MAVVLTIGGVTKELRRGSLNISQTANGRTTASFSVVSTDGSYRPAMDAEVLITEDGTRIFGGLVERPTEQGLLAGAHAGITTQISAVDFHQYADRRIIPDGGFPAGYTLLQALTALVAWVTPFGVTLDAGQVTGPTLPELLYPYTKLTDVFNELATITSKDGEPYVWRISPTKVLRMYQPSTVAAPFNIVGNTPSQVIGDIVVETTREHYANRIYLKTPTKSEVGRVETFDGDGVTDTFTLQYTPTKFYGTIGTTTNPYETLNYTGDADPATWTYDVTTNTITRNDGAPGGSDTVSVRFDGTYSGVATAQDAGEIAANGEWEKVVVVENVPNDTTLQALADAYLAQSLPLTQTVKYRTFTSGLVPAQTQTITVPRRNLSVTAVITDVVTRDLGRATLVRDITAIVDAQTNLGGRGWRDVYKLWAGDKNGSAAPSVATGAGAPTKAGPGGPNKAVQFNRSGVFGGDGDFTYDEATNSIVCGGGGSSITAADVESCQVFGYDCHIAD